MGRKLKPTTKVELDADTDHEIDKWAKDAGRSKRRHISVLVRRLTALRKTNADELLRLQLA